LDGRKEELSQFTIYYIVTNLSDSFFIPTPNGSTGLTTGFVRDIRG